MKLNQNILPTLDIQYDRDNQNQDSPTPQESLKKEYKENNETLNINRSYTLNKKVQMKK